jgi:hypothetical protein
VAVGTLLGTAVQVRAEENGPHEPWEFDNSIFKTRSHWTVKEFKADDRNRRGDEDKSQYDVRLHKGTTEKLTKALAESYKVDKKPEEITKDLIALINQFNKLEGSKALAKVQVEETISFLSSPEEYFDTEESKRIRFYQFMKLKHEPIELNTLGRNETDLVKTRDRCTVVVRYEFVDDQEKRDEDEKDHKEAGKKYTPALKTKVYYLDETRGNYSSMHLYKPDGTWDRMNQN